MNSKIKLIFLAAALSLLNACATKTSAFDFALNEDEMVAYHKGGVVVRAWVTFDEKPGNIERTRLENRFKPEEFLAQGDGIRYVQSYARTSVWGLKYANFAAVSRLIPQPLQRGDIVDVLLTPEEDLQWMREGGRDFVITSTVVGLVCKANDSQCKKKIAAEHGAEHGLIFREPEALGYPRSIFEVNVGRDLTRP